MGSEEAGPRQARAERPETKPGAVDFIPRNLLRTPGRLGLTQRPGALWPGRSLDPDVRLDEDVRRYVRDHDAAVLVTLLDGPELANAGRIDLAARRAGLRWKHLPLSDGGIPASVDEARRQARWALRHLESGRTVVLHCKAGLGRSGTMAACVLVMAGVDADRAIAAVRTARPGAIENPWQEVFVRELAARRSC